MRQSHWIFGAMFYSCAKRRLLSVTENGAAIRFEQMTNGLQSSDREFWGLMYQPLAALASPISRPTTAQLRVSSTHSRHRALPIGYRLMLLPRSPGNILPGILASCTEEAYG
jgi:hypothetical protein